MGIATCLCVCRGGDTPLPTRQTKNKPNTYKSCAGHKKTFELHGSFGAKMFILNKASHFRHGLPFWTMPPTLSKNFRFFKAHWKRSLVHLGLCSEGKKLKCRKSKTRTDKPIYRQAGGWKLFVRTLEIGQCRIFPRNLWTILEENLSRVFRCIHQEHISIRGSIHRTIGPSVHPSVSPSVMHLQKPIFPAVFDQRDILFTASRNKP